jgi:predicted nucleic acid-binding protein
MTSHEAHERCRAELAGSSPRLIAHVAFETVSVLTRMPEGQRVAPALVVDALARNFGDSWLALPAAGQRLCLHAAVKAGLRGGALYDALIAATASKHDITLLSADRRAGTAYEAMGVRVRYVEE